MSSILNHLYSVNASSFYQLYQPIQKAISCELFRRPGDKCFDIEAVLSFVKGTSLFRFPDNLNTNKDT